MMETIKERLTEVEKQFAEVQKKVLEAEKAMMLGKEELTRLQGAHRELSRLLKKEEVTEEKKEE